MSGCKDFSDRQAACRSSSIRKREIREKKGQKPNRNVKGGVWSARDGGTARPSIHCPVFPHYCRPWNTYSTSHSPSPSLRNTHNYKCRHGEDNRHIRRIFSYALLFHLCLRLMNQIADFMPSRSAHNSMIIEHISILSSEIARCDDELIWWNSPELRRMPHLLYSFSIQ